MKNFKIISICVMFLLINCQKGKPYLEFTAVELYSADSVAIYFSEPFVVVDTSSVFNFALENDINKKLEIDKIFLTSENYGVVFKLQEEFSIDSVYQFTYSPLNCEIEAEYIKSTKKMSGTGVVNFKVISLDSILFAEDIKK